ncbi:MAG: LytR/AlgR family response regulator transcription factor [Bacteroidota bacterium]|jgi:two-component system LytT family response regulator|nr:response regulator transcription factor [Ignavibacteria bacterium]MCU7500156.1 response regulator transcription factor [Ignavibacteria bacterium]MCU7511543.1 response regulator transcription factor [Ignavibacteria bacterium]MCU7521048.1 response regulator transcription factor [Ignavibacteria bacterium]MCU7524331.1 response regulator transcription factor [Ignavibacteria bacterium]
MKALIIDDERLARVELRRLLSPYPEINIVGEAVNTEDALEKIRTLEPDLLFLDIQMPGMGGFELLEKLDHAPEVIFTTAYDEFALKAFDYNALDYLLKPILPRRLESAVKKVLDRKGSPHNATGQPVLGAEDRIFVKDGDKCWFVKLSDIKFFESEGNYVRIHFDHFKPLVLKSLNSIDERLDPRSFFRANRSFIVNLKWIETIETSISGGLIVVLRGGAKIEISRRRSLKFREMLSL